MNKTIFSLPNRRIRGIVRGTLSSLIAYWKEAIVRILHVCSIVVVVAMVCCAGSHAAVLYDGSINAPPGEAPTDQGWLYLTVPSVASAAATVADGATTLDTTPVTTDSAGFFTTVTPFTSQPGVSVRFTVKVISEDHFSDTNRAGFSVIVLDSALNGVELAFWDDEIWAQTDNPLFEHSAGEQAAFDTTAALTEYQLDFLQGSTYSLSVVGGNTLFNGDVKNYSAHSHPTYSTRNLLFFGDNSTSAEAEVVISRVEMIPEPASAAVLLVGFAATLARRKRSAA